MFSTFTTEHGALVVQTQKIVAIEDGVTTAVLLWDAGHEVMARAIQGTARENLARLFAEDQARAAAYARSQATMQQGLPMPPIPRGKAAGRG